MSHLDKTSQNSNHLMFARTVHNHINNGYFPTDDATVAGIVQRLDVLGDSVRIFDPCCGEGTALNTIADHLMECGANCTSFGIELDANRAKLAQDQLDSVIKADIEDCILQARTVGLLFLNPPYGLPNKDQFSNQRTQRLEEMFFSRTAGVLQEKGILVLIVPAQSLSEKFTKEIATHFTEIRIFKAAVDTYKQYVIMGIRSKRNNGKKLIEEQQQRLLAYEAAPSLNDAIDFWYEVPQMEPQKTFRPICHRITEEQLREELMVLHKQTLWTHFQQFFGTQSISQKRRPLCALGKWHSALALAAGQVNGIVSASDGRKLLIKGSTHKIKVNTVSEELDNKGSIVVTTTSTDKFVPIIRAINLTQNTPHFGDVITIK